MHIKRHQPLCPTSVNCIRSNESQSAFHRLNAPIRTCGMNYEVTCFDLKFQSYKSITL